MATRSTAAVRYGKRLDKAIKAAGFSVRGLAKTMRPEAPESERATLHKYLRGDHLPGLRKRIEMARILRDRTLVDDEDEEEAELALELMEVVRALVAREAKRKLPIS